MIAFSDGREPDAAPKDLSAYGGAVHRIGAALEGPLEIAPTLGVVARR